LGICRSRPGRPESQHHLQTASAGPDRYRTEPGRLYLPKGAVRTIAAKISTARSNEVAIGIPSIFIFFSGKIHFTDTKLPLDRFVEIGAAGIIFPPTSDRSWLLSYSRPRTRATVPLYKWRLEPGHPWGASSKLSIGLDRAAHISLFLRLLRLVVKAAARFR